MKSYQKKVNNNVRKGGVVLLIAMLISTVALSVGLGVYNRTYKEVLFASYWKQAQIAFSAADSGLECAMYWDKNPAASALCFNSTVSGASWTPGSAGSFSNVPVSGGCVNVTITKIVAPPSTIIESRGRNTCDATSSRVLEMALGVQY